VLECKQIEKYRFVWTLFDNLGLIQKYGINMEKFPHFIFAVQEKYNQYQNPYHNYEHGINVLHATYLFIKKTKIM